MRIVIDSSVFVASFSPRDAHHHASGALFALLAEEEAHEVVLPSLVPLETIHILMQHGVVNDPTEILAHFAGYTVAPLDMVTLPSFLDAMRYFRLKTGDAIIAATALLNRATLVSFDARLLAAYRPHGKVWHPTAT